MSERYSSFEVLLDKKEVPETYPPPAPPAGRKADIFDAFKFMDIDDRARKAPRKLDLSFPELTAYLTDGMISDLQKLRSLFIWLGSRDLLDGNVYTVDLPATTPGGFLKLITESDTNDFVLETLFIHLCRAAGLPCLPIEGYTKGFAGFEVGDTVTWPNTSWTAVYVDGSWRFVDPVGAFIGFVEGGQSEWVLLEESGQAVRVRVGEQDQAVRGRVQQLKEDYFLTDPEVFIHFCLPIDPAWQLLPEKWTKDKFDTTPLFSWHFFKTSWHLADKHRAVAEAPGGKCCITMDEVPEDEATIRYKLFFNEKKSKGKIPQELQLDNYVIRTRTTKQQSVMTRLPAVGIYKLKILDKKGLTLCSLRIDCTGKIAAQKRFPETPEKGYGFSQEAIDAGLVDPSREEGMVVAKEGEKIRFRFRTNRPLVVRARLVHSVLPSQDLDSRMTQEQEDDLVTVKVKVPWEAHNPEFSLQVDAKEVDSEGEFVNVLNYLLTPDRELVQAVGDTQKQLQDELQAATADDDLHRLESALREARGGNALKRDLAVKAYTRLYDLHRSAIEGAMKDEGELATALREADASQVAYMLHQADWYQRAQNTLRRMHRLSSVKHEVHSLSGKQVSEVHTYNKPLPGIQAAIVATYSLLGESRKKLKKWTYVQSLLRAHGKHSIIYRINNFDITTIDKSQVQHAASLLDTCSEEEVRSLSIGAAAFYNWSKAIVESTNEKDVVAEDNYHAESVQSNDDDDQQIEEDSETGT